MEGPINPRNYTNTAKGCNSCGKPWKDTKELKDSHCHFCGKSSCKLCMTKSRNFKHKRGGERQLDKSGREVRLRGQICKLCDRKFLTKDIVQKTLKEITAHNLVLKSALSQQENFKKEIQDVKDNHAKAEAEEKHKLKAVEDHS